MKHLSLGAILSLALTFSTRATTVEITVTPASLDTYFYTFSVSTNAAAEGTAFHITMTAKTSDIETDDSGASLQMLTHTGKGGGMLVSSQPLEPAIPVTLKKEKRIWTADFVLPEQFSKNSNVYFNFNFLAHSMANGKKIAMPSTTHYEIRLMDFTGQISTLLNGRWQTESGDTYEFSGNEYVHWLQKPPISKSGQADASELSNRSQISKGKFSVSGNFLVLIQNNGPSLTNQFYLTKGDAENVTGKFFGTGYSFIILSGQNISKYELMYR